MRLFLLFAVLLTVDLLHAKEDMVIGLEKAPVRVKPSLLSKALGFLKYGQSPRLQKQKGTWYQVHFKGKTGWIHKSSLATARFVLKDIGKGKAVAKDSYKDDVVTAGKGFNPEYEKLYKDKNPKISFAPVDRLEKAKVSPRQMHRFAKGGRLKSRMFASEAP